MSPGMKDHEEHQQVMDLSYPTINALLLSGFQILNLPNTKVNNYVAKSAGTQRSLEYDLNIRHATVRWAVLENLINPPPAFK